jgi:glycosyltransferase involved in cell wall biosynthesis
VPDITAVVPTRNRRELLRLTLSAILGQQNVDLEVIVVDEGSDDDTVAMVGNLGDRRIRVVRHERPTGVSVARNHGAAEATAGWLAFCDDDDLWAPDKLARQLAAAAETGRNWAYGGAVRIDVHGNILSAAPAPPPEALVERLPMWNLMPGGSSNVIVRADLFSRIGGWNPALVNLADWDLWVRLAQDGLPACVSAPLVGYRIHGGNASQDTNLILREARALNGRYSSRLDYGALYLYLASVCQRSSRRWRALRYFMLAAGRGQGRAVRGVFARHIRRRIGRARSVRLDATIGADWISEAERWIAPFRRAELTRA